jgi:hypothetical protein
MSRNIIGRAPYLSTCSCVILSAHVYMCMTETSQLDDEAHSYKLRRSMLDARWLNYGKQPIINWEEENEEGVRHGDLYMDIADS